MKFAVGIIIMLGCVWTCPISPNFTRDYFHPCLKEVLVWDLSILRKLIMVLNRPWFEKSPGLRNVFVWSSLRLHCKCMERERESRSNGVSRPIGGSMPMAWGQLNDWRMVKRFRVYYRSIVWKQMHGIRGYRGLRSGLLLEYSHCLKVSTLFENGSIAWEWAHYFKVGPLLWEKPHCFRDRPIVWDPVMVWEQALCWGD